METRKITIVSSKTQKKSVITTGAETLAELKRDLDAQGISYDGMTFYEGTSRTELKDDLSRLPKDVLYKGNITNELVFMLTNTDKKIKSGSMSRKEAYDAIKKLGLQGAVKATYGKNFTVCSTNDLIDIINDAKGARAGAPKVIAKPTTKKEPVTVVETTTPEVEFVDKGAREALRLLVEALVEDSTLYETDAEKVYQALDATSTSTDKAKEEEEGGYSNSEIDDMFNFL